MKIPQVFAGAAVVLLCMAGRVWASDVEFTFDTPIAPDTPIITSVTNSAVVYSLDNFSVYASIEGREQLETCCDPGQGEVCTHECAPDCDFSGCEITDFYGSTDPTIDPNPTCIPNTNDTSGGENPGACGGKSNNPMLYYYYNYDYGSVYSTAMTYDSGIEKFVAQVDTTALTMDDTVHYFITASDNKGQVVSMLPYPDSAPCTTVTSWYDSFDTPAFDNCSVMNIYQGIAGND